MGRAFRCRLGRHAHDLGGINTRLASAARQVRRNRFYPAIGKPTTPSDDLPATDFESAGNLVITHAISRQQHNLRTPDAARIQCLRAHSPFQFNTLRIRQIDPLALIHHPLHQKDVNMTKTITVGSNISKALH